MSGLPCTKEKLQRQKWWSQGRAQKSTGIYDVQLIWSYMIYFNTVFCFIFGKHNNWHEGFFSPLRRIDVSPSAFKRHSHLFEDMEETNYKVTSPFEIWCIWNKQIWDDPQQQCSALCFSFKGCIFLNQKSPIVFCKCQASPQPMRYGYWLGMYEPKQRLKGSELRSWVQASQGTLISAFTL